MGDEALQHVGVHPPHRDARLVKPHQDVPAGTSIAGERIRRISAPGALGQELLEQAQALVELARMLDVSALLEEPNEPERPGDELPGATGEHLATLAFHSRAPAIVAAKAPQHGVVDHADVDVLLAKPDQEMTGRRAKAADPASGQTRLLQVLDEWRKTSIGGVRARSRTWTARVGQLHWYSFSGSARAEITGGSRNLGAATRLVG